MVLLYTRTQIKFGLLILSLCYRSFWSGLSRRKSLSSIFPNLKRFELKKTTLCFISTEGLYEVERREKSIFQLLPPGVSLLEKFALNISANNEAMVLKLGRDVAPYEIYQMVPVLMLLWQHAWFRSPASPKLNITIYDLKRQNTWCYLRRMPVPPSISSPR